MKKLSRRDFIRLMGLGAGAAALNACQPILNLPAAPTSTLIPPTLAVTTAPRPPLEFTLRADKGEASILSGTKTRVWQYHPTVTGGDENAIQTLPGTYLGPIIHAWRGQTLRVHLENALPEPTIVHWHGLRIPEEADGHPRLAIDTGQTYDYEFTIVNRAGTYWFHPHPHMRTGAQAYFGMAGLLIIHDDEEQAAGLPSGAFDLPLVIQDRVFDADNQLLYNASMMDAMQGFLGDTVLVNGQANFRLPVAAQPHRLRLLNGSNARIYKLAFSDGSPLTVIGSDGGLLQTPVTREYVALAPAERVELWVDFSRYKQGETVKLISQEFVSSTEGMMGGGMGMGGLPQGIPLNLAEFSIEQEATDSPALPPALSNPNFDHPEDSSAARRFEFAMQGMIGTINGLQFDMENVTDNETVKAGALETWEFANIPGRGMGMMGNMAQPHPVHMHGVQFQVLSRKVDSAYQSMADTLSAGFVDDGWKDTVLTLPGMTVQVLVRFSEYTGLYMYHCHNLEHEDNGMMRNFRVA